MKILLVLLMILTTNTFSNGQQSSSSTKKARSYLLNKPECTAKRLKENQLTIAKLFTLGEHGRPFPENDQQLKMYCKDTTRYANKIETFFNTCYEKRVRDYAKVMLFSVRNAVRTFCKKRSKKTTQLVALSPCMNEHLRTNTRCLHRFYNDTKQLFTIAEDRLKLPHTCCNAAKSIKCVSDHVDEVPCTRTNRPLVMEFVNSLLSNIIDVMCGEYNDETDRCEKLGPQPPPKAVTKTVYFEFGSLLIDLLESMKGFHAL